MIFTHFLFTPTFASMSSFRRIVFILLLTWLQASAYAKNLTLLSYNIRYDNPADGVNAWPNRKENVFALIRSHHPDIFCIQEGLSNQVEDLRKAFSPAYASYGVGRDDGRSAGEFCAIFYAVKKFTCLDSGTFWLSENADTPGSVGWDAAITRICSWLVLKEKKSGKSFVVLNTHFDHMGQRAQEASAALIKSRIPSIAGDMPFLICGDFNCEPGSAAWKELTESAPAGMRPLSPHGKNTCTFKGFECASSICKCIDFHFASKHFTCKKSMIDDRHKGAYYPSDHFAVVSRLRMN